MKSIARWAVLATAAAVLGSLLPGCGGPKVCGSGTCAGCCNDLGECQPGASESACGTGGRACSVCGPAGGTPAANVCHAGFCTGAASDGGGGGGGAIPGGSFEGFCAEFAQTWCTQMVTCKKAEPSLQLECTSSLQRALCGANLLASFTRGYQAFDPAVAAACLEGLRSAAASCETYAVLMSYDLCSTVLTPNVASGGSCAGGRFLLGRGDCLGRTQVCFGSGCAKTCQTSGALGLPCRSYGCDPGSWCDIEANLCRAPAPAGAACTSGSQCQANSYCDTQQQKCVLLPVNGQACRSGGFPACAPGTYCDYAANPDVCRSAVPDGQSCGSSAQCLQDSFCDSASGSTCQPKRAAGGACASSGGCQDGLRCVNSLCAPLVGEGGSCRASSECQSGLRCDVITRTCEYSQPALLAESCTGDTRHCQGLNLACRGLQQSPDGGVGSVGTCQRPQPGDRCTGGGCAWGEYCPWDGGSFGGSCVAAALGTPCYSSYHCQSAHYCLSGACAARIPNAQPCPQEPSDSCLAPQICRLTGPDGGLCGEPGGEGASCFGGLSQCKLPYECVGGTCTLTLLEGARCSEAGGCLNGACLGRVDAGSAGTCGPLLLEGADCRNAQECRSGRCEGGQCAALCN